MKIFNKIGITGRNTKHPQLKLYLHQLISCLDANKVLVQIDSLLKESLDTINIPIEVTPFAKLEQDCDLIIVIGGDGSFLSTARRLQNYQIPITGLNLGHLGFLTEISPATLHKQITEIISGNFILDERFFLQAKIVRNSKDFDREIALNDVVIHPGESARIIEYELYIDDKFVYRQRADGLIIATPTGSTAYALSAGGPVMSPNLDAIVIAPMHPHLLTNRPLVVHGNSNIKVVVTKETSNLPRISCDGQIHLKSCYQDEIIIRKSTENIKLYNPPDYNFYKSCRSKLSWNANGYQI
jgi:NAD+ kinase